MLRTTPAFERTRSKVRVRIASTLGDTDDDVRELFHLVAQYYDLRSTVVHGDVLKEKHQALLLNSGDWLEVARLAINAFMAIAEAGAFQSGKKVREEIDAILIHGKERGQLRARYSVRWSAAKSRRVATAGGRIVGYWADSKSSAVVTVGS